MSRSLKWAKQGKDRSNTSLTLDYYRLMGEKNNPETSPHHSAGGSSTERGRTACTKDYKTLLKKVKKVIHINKKAPD